MRYTTSLQVEAAPTVAFDYLADGRHGLRSHPRGTTFTQEPPDRIDLGTRYTFDRPGGPMFHTTIVRYEPPSRLEFESAFEGQSPTTSFWTFEPSGTGTRLTVATVSSFIGPTWMRPFVGLLTLGAWPLFMLKMWQWKRDIVRALDQR
jgi:uncharacterized protein YndB with AHSA1/START domain